MQPDDVDKIVFHMHDGYYKFLVMLFSPFNLPATFQTLMNHLFHQHLRKFVLIFYDDILINSGDLETHQHHLH